MNSNIRTVRRQQWFNFAITLLVCASLMLGTMAAAPFPQAPQETPDPALSTTPTSDPNIPPTDAATPTPETQPTEEATAVPTEEAPLPTETAPAPTEVAPAAAPAQQENPPEAAYVDYHKIVVLFKDNTGQVLQGTSAQAASEVQSAAASILSGLEISPVFPDEVAAAQSEAAAAAGGETAVLAENRLARYFNVQLTADKTYTDAKSVLDQISGLANVETAYFESIYVPADDFTGNQTYRLPADTDNGVNADYANTIAGGYGNNVIVADIEQGWQIGHEDLPISKTSLLSGSVNASDPQFINHGTMVLGVIAAKNNNDAGTPIGMVGIAPNAEIRLGSALSLGMAGAINKATGSLRAGDIIVIPMQTLVAPPSGKTAPAACDRLLFGALPVEYTSAVFDAIKAATDKGIIVIEAAGNGGVNLDWSAYGNLFKRSSRNSGALLVGAGTSADREPMCYSNYGSRLDVQGWGENIATTGHTENPADDLDAGLDSNTYYTSNFGGTSGASAMVAGVAASLQGVAKNRGYRLSPAQMRKVLIDTGHEQTDPAVPAPEPDDYVNPEIGPLPDLKAGIDKWLTSGVRLISPGDTATAPTVDSLKPTLIWQEYLGASSYRVQIASGSTFSNVLMDKETSGTQYTLTSNLTAGSVYWWRVSAYATNADGTSSWRSYSTPFQFTINPNAIEIPAPTIVTPKSGALSANPDPLNTKVLIPTLQPDITFKHPSPIPTGYQFEISSDPTFGGDPTAFSLVDEFADDGLAPANQVYTVSAPLDPNKKFYWHMRAYRDVGAERFFSAWTTVYTLYSPIDPALTTPPTLSNTDTPRPTLDWDDIAEARAYQVQYRYERTTVATGVVSARTLATVNVTIPSGKTEPPSTYSVKTDLPRTISGVTEYQVFFRYRVLGKYGYSIWSDEVDMATVNAPGTPKLSTPKSKTVSTTVTPTLTWGVPTFAPVGYQVQFSVESDFDTTLPVEAVKTQDVAGASDAGNLRLRTFVWPGADALTTNTLYYWRVRAINAAGEYGNWTSPYTLYTSTVAPAGLNIPVLDSLRPTFAWTPVVGARSYVMQVSSDTLFKKILATADTLGTVLPFEITVTLPRSDPNKVPYPTTLYWRVKAIGTYGSSAWTEDLGGFNTPNPPQPPVLVSPRNGILLTDFKPRFDWNAPALLKNNLDSNPDTYQLQVATSYAFEPANIVLDKPGLAATEYSTATGELPDSDTYFWRVRAVNLNGENSIWSPIFKFVTPGIVKGVITDLETGAPISNAALQIAGRGGVIQANALGEYQIFGLPRGSYRLTATTADASYIPLSYIVSIDNGLTRTLNFKLPKKPAKDSDTLRFVLTWQGEPQNLDAHFWFPSTDKAHIYKNNLGTLAGFPNALHSGDVDNGFGPEMVTFKYASAPLGTYTFGVYFDTDRSKIYNSGAIVTVYDEDKAIGTFVVPPPPVVLPGQPPAPEPGRWWKVFTVSISSTTHSVTNVGTLSDDYPVGYSTP